MKKVGCDGRWQNESYFKSWRDEKVVMNEKFDDSSNIEDMNKICMIMEILSEMNTSRLFE